MTVTFKVDDVERASERPRTRRLADVLGEHLALGGNPDLAVLEGSRVQALMGAVHVAFAEHRPLVLSPDAVWLTLAHGLAHHVAQNAEALRPRLVRHNGKKDLCVEWQGPFPRDAHGLAQVMELFQQQVAQEIGAGPARLLGCSFSTSTNVERVAGHIALMDTYRSYFDLVLMCVCGIPEITLTGTVEDWSTIRARVDVLAELDLEWWARSLRPIADKFVEAAQGNPDQEFFRRIYKPREAYGDDVATGWITRLYPYVSGNGDYARRNPMLELPLDWVPDEPEEPFYNGPGLTTGAVPAGVPSCVVHVRDLTAGTAFQVVLEGGVQAVEVDDAGRLIPCVSWVARPPGTAKHAAVVDALKQREDTRTPVATTTASPQDDRGLRPAELTALARAFPDGATFFATGTPWTLRPPQHWERVSMFPTATARHPDALTVVVDLADGTSLGFLYLVDGALWLRVARDGISASTDPRRVDGRVTRQTMDQTPAAGRSLLALLQQAAETGGTLDWPSGPPVWEFLDEHTKAWAPFPKGAQRT